MRQVEFDYEIAKVESAYQGKGYSPEQESILWEENKNLTVESFKMVCDSLIKTKDRLPSIAQFYVTRRDMSSQMVYERPPETDCPVCEGLGLRFAAIKTDRGPYRVVARCSCDNSARWSATIMTADRCESAYDKFIKWLSYPSDIGLVRRAFSSVEKGEEATF